SRGARRLVPHADRGPCDRVGQSAAFPRHDREARRQRGVRGQTRRHGARCGATRRQCGCGAEGARWPGFLCGALIMRLLGTRPEPDNERTAATLRAKGHDVMLAPMLRIEAVPNVDLGAPPWSGVLLTSANGARALAAHPRRGELL